jgi:hypothetical protein
MKPLPSLAAAVAATLLALPATDALAQACTPVVYVFRHAEDTNPPNPPGPIFALTPTGKAHAALYPAMVNDFQAANGFCPVAKVYATTKVEKQQPCGSACASATNAFDTGAPLAQSVMGAAPITVAGGNQLYEYLGNGNDAPASPNYSTPTASALRAELLAAANGGKSSAIFWTSQGMHVLGGVIINANSNVPVKNGGAIPPRNSVYLFKAAGTAPNITTFGDTPTNDSLPVKSSVYVQCFNHVEASTQFNPPGPRFIAPTGTPPVQLYYCGYDNAQSNIGGKPGECALDAQCGSIRNEENALILGKICNTATSMLPNTSGPSMFGACR